jgi:hypothetical protein
MAKWEAEKNAADALSPGTHHLTDERGTGNADSWRWSLQKGARTTITTTRVRFAAGRPSLIADALRLPVEPTSLLVSSISFYRRDNSR